MSFQSTYGISYEVLNSDHTDPIKPDSKVIIVTPEKLMSRCTMSDICQLSWSALVIDEPQYTLQWGTSKRNRKPFREAFRHLNKLNELGSPFELHTATAQNVDDIFSLLCRKNSTWIKQILVPERKNLKYLLVDGKDISDIKKFKFVTKHLESEFTGTLLIFVQKIEEGTKILYSLNEYANENGLITWPSKSDRPERPVVFLHANVTSERKEEIISNTIAQQVKILVPTSSIGVNLPIKTLLGWL